MATFEEAITIVMIHEGSFSNDPDDLGGCTKFGISLRFYETVKPEATVDDVKNLTREMACEIYRKEFWDKYKYGLITDQRLATKIFDMAVNMGPKEAHTLAQRALIAATGHKFNQDGILGPETLYNLNNVNAELIYVALKSEAAGYYRLLVAEHQTQNKYLSGWLDRAYSDF